MSTITQSPPGRPAATTRPSRRSNVRRGEQRAAWLFLTPSLVVLAVFLFWPMIQAGYLSFTDYSLLQPAHWIGTANYRRLIDDEAARNALRNTAVYTLISTPLSVGLALGIAVMLNTRIPLRGFLRTAVFLPFVLSLSIVSIAWSFLLDPNLGMLSDWLHGLGLVTEQGLLTDPQWAMPAVIAVGIWKNVGFYMLMYLAGLQGIPAEMYEAARVDGAGRLRRFRSITWPLLSNQTMLITVIATITNIQAFDQIYVMTQGGPFFKTETIVPLIYRSGFSNLQFGYAAAISWVLTGLILLVALCQVAYFRRRAVQY
ncbi:carbohydrate ABC transporter permease [Dactylosporangium sp. CA-233914]|uniref:carbohydrate ABC transporter permease n=1 Tax=Dactylosporangium sp. CA-233914 TaxID=3239934 RepID=UPI003D8A0B07